MSSISTESASSQQAGVYRCNCERGESRHEVRVRLNVLKMRLEVKTDVIEARPGDKVMVWNWKILLLFVLKS